MPIGNAICGTGRSEGVPVASAKNAVEHLSKQAQIFKAEQQKQIDGNAHRQNSFSSALRRRLVKQESAGIIHRNGSQHDQHINRFSPRIEKQAGCRQEEIDPFARKNSAAKQHNRKEHPKKNQRAEQHPCSSSFLFKNTDQIRATPLSRAALATASATAGPTRLSNALGMM